MNLNSWKPIFSAAALACAACVSENTAANRNVGASDDANLIVSRFEEDKGRVLAIAAAGFGIRVATETREGIVQLWDGETGEPVGAPLQLAAVIPRVIFNEDGSLLVTADGGGRSDKTVRLWNAKTGAQIGGPLSASGVFEDVLFGQPAKRVVVLTCENAPGAEWKDATTSFLQTSKISIWNSITGAPVGRTILLEDTPGGCGGLSTSTTESFARLSPDKNYLVFRTGNEARVVSLRTGRQVGRTVVLPAPPSRDHPSASNGYPPTPADWLRARAPQINRSNTRLLLEGEKERLWSVRTGKPIGGAYSEYALAEFSPDGTRIVFDCDYTLAWGEIFAGKLPKPTPPPALFDAKTGRKIAALPSYCNRAGEYQSITTRPKPEIFFSPDSKRILTNVDPLAAQLWNARTGAPVGAPIELEAPVGVALFNDAGTRLLTTSVDGSVRLWDTRNGDEIGEQLGLANPETSDDIGYAGTPPIWPIEKFLRGAMFSPDGKRVLARLHIDWSDPYPAWAQLWDTQSGARVGRSIYLKGGMLILSAFSPDGKILATGSEDKSVCLWDSATGEAVGGPLKLNAWVANMAFNSSGTRLVVATYETHPSTIVWNVGKALRAGAAEGCESGPTPAPIVLDERYLANKAKLEGRQKGVRSLIYYGTPVKAGEFSEVVSILGKELCTGTIISPSVVLTAAHCFVDETGSRLDTRASGVAAGRVGSGTNAFRPEVEKEISDIRIHPSYKAPGDGVDLALVHLNGKLPGKPVAIAPGRWVDDALPLRVVGYGKTEFRDSGSKLWADTIVVSPSCNGVASENRSDAEVWGCQQNMELVAHLSGQRIDTCKGDSGGPAFVVDPQASSSPDSFVEAMDKGAYALGAVTSRGVLPSGACGDGGIYVRITDDARQWISQQAAAWGEALGPG